MKHRLFLCFSTLYTMLLPRFYLFYIYIIVLRYIAFSRYIFVVFMVFCIKSHLVLGVLPCIFIASFECVSPCLARNQARSIGFLPPYHRVFHSQIGVFVWAWRISIWQQRRYAGWLVGWLVRLRSFRLFSLGQIAACRSLIIMPVFDKILSSGGFSSGLHTFETLSKHAFFGEF